MAAGTIQEVLEKAKQAREATTRLGAMTRGEKDRLLLLMADEIEAKKGAILEANAKDIKNAQDRKLSAAPIDRLMVNDKRVKEMADGLRDLARLSDPVGEIIEGWRLPNGLEIAKVRIPLGVIGIIYESRPNVTVDAAGLCLKSGNATILRGGSDAINSNIALVNTMNAVAVPAGLPEGAISIIESTDREAAAQLMRMDEYIDVLIPRGGHDLIRRVKRESTVPVIETGEGICHVYLDASADLAKAEPIVVNAKCQRPSVCNAAETLLVHKDCAATLLPPIGKKLSEMGVELRACERSIEYLEEAKPATEEDWATEYLSLILSVRMVDTLEEAIAHVKRYSTRNSDAIITEDLASARKFTQEVDSAVVYVNASTRFTDGGQFGFGAEIGISNQKLHARGPMGLRELTIYKYVVWGEGQIRA